MPGNLGFVAAAYAVVLLSVLGYTIHLRLRRARLQAQLQEPADSARAREGAASQRREPVTTD
jgi:heme exporter protein D